MIEAEIPEEKSQRRWTGLCQILRAKNDNTSTSNTNNDCTEDPHSCFQMIYCAAKKQKIIIQELAKDNLLCYGKFSQIFIYPLNKSCFCNIIIININIFFIFTKAWNTSNIQTLKGIGSCVNKMVNRKEWGQRDISLSIGYLYWNRGKCSSGCQAFVLLGQGRCSLIRWICVV